MVEVLGQGREGEKKECEPVHDASIGGVARALLATVCVNPVLARGDNG